MMLRPLALVAVAAVLAAEDLELPGLQPPVIVPFTVSANAGADRELPVELHDQPGEFSRTTLRAGAKTQAWHDAQDELVLSAAATWVRIQSDAAFPTTGPLPDRLYDLRGGVAFRHVTGDQQVYGATVSVGSASDHPFHDADDLSLSASVSVRIPVRTADAWLLSLSYSNQRAVLNGVPFPGITYVWKPNEATTALIGVPFSGVLWRPTPRLGAELFLSGFGYAHVGASLRPLAELKPLKLRAALDYGGDTYRRADAPDRADRITFRELRATFGCGVDAGPRGGIEIYGGYAWFRVITEGHSLFQRDNRIEVEPGMIAGATANCRF